jgi:hypothetical protein
MLYLIHLSPGLVHYSVFPAPGSILAAAIHDEIQKLYPG